MNAYFNDATLTPSPQDNMLFLRGMKEVWDEFLRTTGFTGKMFSLPLNMCERLAWLRTVVEQSGERELITFFCRTIKPEFMQEIEQENGSDVNSRFDNSEFKVKVPPNEEVECKILGWAMLNHGITFGLASRFWNQSKPDIELIIREIDLDNNDIVESHETVRCVTRKEHLQLREIKELLYKIISQESGAEDETVCDPPDVDDRRKKGKIIVLGAERLGCLLQEARNLRFDIQRFEFVRYDRSKNYGCDRWKNNKAIAAIMIGPVPHSGAGMGEANNLKNAIRKEEGYPPSVELEDSTRKLKVTTTSFRNGLDELVKRKAIVRNFDS